jgi:hypothetical protein
MTGRELVQALAKHVTFPPSTASKRFVHDMAARPADYLLSPRAEAFAWRIAYHFRRRLPREIATEVARRKVDHRWEIGVGRQACAVCGQFAYSKRDVNAPCPGPPSENRRKVVFEQKAVAGAIEVTCEVEMPLFEEGNQ